MLLVDSLAEKRILQAIRSGDLDDLRGMGEPLLLDDDSGIPGELRVAYRALKNADCLPPELTLRKDILRLENLLDQVEFTAERQAMRKRLCLLKARLAMHGRDGDLLALERDYREKLLLKLARHARPEDAAINPASPRLDTAGKR
jgi:nitrogen fixation-related uncharacterized protein